MSHTDFLCSPEGGGGGWLALYCMNMYAYGEILTTLFTGLGNARSVSEHTYITYDWYDVHCPIILELTDSISNRELKNIDNQLFGGFGIDFAKKKNPTELCMYSF